MFIKVIRLFYNEYTAIPPTCNSHLLTTMETGQVRSMLHFISEKI